MGRLSSQDCSGNKRPPADGRNLGDSPHIFAHKHSGLQNVDDRGLVSGRTRAGMYLIKTHARTCTRSLQDSHDFDVFQNKESPKIAQRTLKVSLKSQRVAAEIFLASNRAVNGKKEQRDTGREKAKRWSQETESEFI